MKAKHIPVAPPLPGGCVDFNKLHEAAMANADPRDALARALIVPKREMGTATLTGGRPAPRSTTTAPATAAKQEDSTNA